jgi:glycosyltransferase involved in cell wall biosynthesis
MISGHSAGAIEAFSPAARRVRPAAPFSSPLSVRVLLVHNHYQQPGGEDQVFREEGALLESRGQTVLRYTLHNDEVEGLGKAALAMRTLWSRTAYREIERRVREGGVDVVHVHNTLPLASPAVYWAARRAGAAVVQTLHNFRLVCPGALLLRDGRSCTACLGRLPLPAVRHACYRGSRPATAAVAAMLTAHRAAGTWAAAVDRYVALTDFARELFVRGGLPAEKIAVKPNFLRDDPGAGRGGGGFALFVGRLSPEKGVEPMLEAWRRNPDLPPLKVVGDGPMARAVEAAPVAWLGPQPRAHVLALMQAADLLVCPSLAWEGMPMTIVEAFACGLPVVASDHGAMAGMVDETAGLRVPPGDPAALAAAVRALLADAPRRAHLRRGARRLFEARYTAARNYDLLLQLYRDALEARHSVSVPVAALAA